MIPDDETPDVKEYVPPKHNTIQEAVLWWIEQQGLLVTVGSGPDAVSTVYDLCNWDDLSGDMTPPEAVKFALTLIRDHFQSLPAVKS